MSEVWLPIVGIANDRFEVSSIGRVRNKRSQRIRRTSLRLGYVRVRLEGKVYSAHRLVTAAFLPNPQGKRCVNHKNGIKSDNRVENLEWATHSENTRHAVAMGLMPLNLGEKNGASKLTDAAALQIRDRYRAGCVRQVDLAAEYRVSQRAISLVTRREKWRHV